MEDYIKYIFGCVIGILILALGLSSFTVVDPTERGVLIVFGDVKEEVMEPGLHVKPPFISRVRKFDTTPIQYKKSLGIGQDGAITSDKQTIGVDYELYWKYDGERIKEIARNYSNKDAIYDPISTALKEIIKDEAGKISISQFINNQSEVSARVKQRLTERVEKLPVEITNFSITNLDWSDDYDAAIKETARIAQQIERAKNEAEVAAAEAQKLVREAEAKKQAEELNAQALVAKANGEAEAKRIAADALAYENQKINQNLAVMKAQWEHEEKMLFNEKWNGKQVSDQAVYVPNTYDLKKQ